MWSFYLFMFLLLCATVGAFWRGESPEQRVCLMLLAAAILSVAVRQRGADAWTQPEAGLFVIDTIVLVGLLWLAVRTGRRWMIWAAALHTTAVLAHVDAKFGLGLATYSYALMAGLSSWFVIILLMAAVWRHPRPEQPASTTLQ